MPILDFHLTRDFDLLYLTFICKSTCIALKFTIAIPCEGSYCRPLIALALAFSPLWFGFYLHMQFDINLWDIRMAIFLSIMAFFGVMVIRYAPGGDGTMAGYISVPIALYGFVVAATWIGKLIPCYINLLAWTQISRTQSITFHLCV